MTELGKILQSITLSTPLFPSPRRDNTLDGCRLSAYTTSYTTLPQPSEVVPLEDALLSFPEAMPASHKARSCG